MPNAIGKFINEARRGLSYVINPDKDINKYLKAFFQWGFNSTNYDVDARTYIEKGVLYNPDVYSIINQQAQKAASIPWKVTIGETDKEFPLKRPNPDQTWSQVKYLQKMFLKATGNVYLYTPSPKDGMNRGIPKGLYVLPSHLMKIVVKENIDFGDYDESPVKSYMLIEGDTYIEFEPENIIHIYYPTPDFDFNGKQLYGLSPLRPLLRNIQSSNVAIDGNVKAMLNSGVFGLLHGKGGATMTQEQAEELKDRLKEMDSSPERLGKIAGVSSEIGLTRLALTPQELQPFEFLKFDQKELCNALSWSDKLLNNDDGGKYDNVSQFRRQVITDNIMPDNDLIDQAYQDKFIQRFKGYEKAELFSTYDHLPEMQEDLNELMDRVVKAVDNGLISRSQGLQVLGWEDFDDPILETRTVKDDVIPLEEAIMNDFNNDQTGEKA